MPWWGIVLIVLGVLIVAFLVFSLTYGRKMQKQQAEAEKAMEANKQYVSILVIDKQKKKLTEAGLPEAVVQSTPKMSRLVKMPVVKAKIGQRVMTLIADQKVYDILPVKKTCTVGLSGMYITELKAIRGGTVPKIEEKKGFMNRLRQKALDYSQKHKQA
ncbi:MAG: hypothetical protein J6Z38_02025 [Lachnospiraceae bacterium]|nr:hypothetical protein [Lachnospiraceae bacterium]